MFSQGTETLWGSYLSPASIPDGHVHDASMDCKTKRIMVLDRVAGSKSFQKRRRIRSVLHLDSETVEVMTEIAYCMRKSKYLSHPKAISKFESKDHRNTMWKFVICP